MIKFRLNPIFLLMLITTFLCLQWVSASTHIHLSENHQHNNSTHEHQNQSHSHQLFSHHQNTHADSIDSSHATESTQVVNLEQTCSTPHNYYKNIDTPLSAPNYPLNLKHKTASFYLANDSQHAPSYLNQSSTQPRAPPTYS